MVGNKINLETMKDVDLGRLMRVEIKIMGMDGG